VNFKVIVLSFLNIVMAINNIVIYRYICYPSIVKVPAIKIYIWITLMALWIQI